MSDFSTEVATGTRFEFGKNWWSFLSVLDDRRIAEAAQSLCGMLEVSDLQGKRFIDVGSGSGLFSLAARRLGASVYSFDFDPQSVACARELKRRYYPDDDRWVISEGSALDAPFIKSLGEFDVVYSWGVLHHTGDLWAACDNVSALVKLDGLLFIAIYNDRGLRSRLWKRVKRLYCSGRAARMLTKMVFVPEGFIRTLIQSVYFQQNLFAQHKRNRGMSIFHDWIDWMGGLPYEFARVEEVFAFFRQRGFDLQKLTTSNDTGNNQFVFVRLSNPRI
jgi:2-polyprenyl-6-hydroxyphenyl methylase/3-demethylubiquinone-9 3-methyltransferase